MEVVVEGRGALPICPLKGSLPHTIAVMPQGQPAGGTGILSTFQPAQT